MDKLYSICWNITNKCNESCKFCYRKLCKDNTLEENKRIIDNLMQISVEKVSFCGGEPLLYDDLFELVKYIRQKNSSIKLAITTNGKVINDTLLKKIIENFDWLTLSLDSLDDEINEQIGRGKEHKNKILSLLKKCNNQIKIKINTVATKVNKNELISIYQVISQFNISRWKVFRFYPIRKGKENREIFYLNDLDSKEIEQQISNFQNGQKNIKIQYNDFNAFTTSYFNIYPDGSIENSKDEEIGNLLETSIQEILKRKEQELIHHELRKNETEKE